MGKHKSADEYWGYLIQPDKAPTPLFQELLLGIAHYISKHVAPWEVKTLTPTKMANFYRLVGGDYDGLFLESPNSSIAFIYRSLGCYHSLQPSKDPFLAPSIPALTNDGFVRWQTVQLLLEPEEHVPFLQEALKRFEIKNPMSGEIFPQYLPVEALPRKPDPDMTRWHDEVGEKLFRASSEAPREAVVPGPAPMAEPPPDAGPAEPRSARQAQHPSGLNVPPPHQRRHSVPDRERGGFHPDQGPPPPFFSPPPHRGYSPHEPMSRHTSNDSAATDSSYFPRPSPRVHDPTPPRSRSGGSRSPRMRRSYSHDRPRPDAATSRSPPPRGVPSSFSPPVSAAAAAPAPAAAAAAAIPRRPPLAGDGSGAPRRHTVFAPAYASKDYPVPHGVPPRTSPPGGPSGRHSSHSAAVPPPAGAGGSSGPANILPPGMQGASPPQYATPVFPPISGHAAAPPTGGAALPPHLRHTSRPLSSRQASASSDGALPGAATGGAAAPFSPPGVRFAADPSAAAAAAAQGVDLARAASSVNMANGAAMPAATAAAQQPRPQQRVRRRTAEERTREREELELERAAWRQSLLQRERERERGEKLRKRRSRSRTRSRSRSGGGVER